MSLLYGTVIGNRRTSTACGTKNSGIRAVAQSYDGSIITDLDYTADGKLLVRIGAAYDKSATTYDELLFSGTIEELKAKLNKA